MVLGMVRRRDRRRNYPVHRQRRVFRDRENPIELFSPSQVWARYRFRPQTIIFLTTLLAAELEHTTINNMALPPLLQVCLRNLASGTFAIVVGDTAPWVTPPTAWRAIDRGVKALIKVLGDDRHTIKFPNPRDEESIKTLKQGFFRVAGRPN